MTDHRSVRIYLAPEGLRNLQQGRESIHTRIGGAVAATGFTVEYREDNEAARLQAAVLPGHAIFQMVEPPNPAALCLRRAYSYPFWRLENTNERWRFEVALADYDPETVDPVRAAPFAARWRHKLVGPRLPSDQGYVFVPLQGRLLERRSFQSMSPLAMIEATLAQDRLRPLLLTLHPNEAYQPEEIDALERLAARQPRVRITKGDARDLLAGCTYVVTQNSSVALTGYLLGKRAILFAGIDFHHIALSVPALGLDEAFRQIGGPAPDPERYLYWFWQTHALDASRGDIHDQIRTRLRRHGWDC